MIERNSGFLLYRTKKTAACVLCPLAIGALSYGWRHMLSAGDLVSYASTKAKMGTGGGGILRIGNAFRLWGIDFVLLGSDAYIRHLDMVV